MPTSPPQRQGSRIAISSSSQRRLSPLRSLALRAPEVAELIGTATRQAFAAIVDLCLAERVDALLLAEAATQARTSSSLWAAESWTRMRA